MHFRRSSSGWTMCGWSSTRGPLTRPRCWATAMAVLSAILFAATHPGSRCRPWSWSTRVSVCDRTGTTPAGSRDGVDFFLNELGRAWGSGALIPFLAPESGVGDELFKDRLARAERLSVSPTDRRRDATGHPRQRPGDPVLPTVSAPTLVLHRIRQHLRAGGLGALPHSTSSVQRTSRSSAGEHLYWLGASIELLDEIEGVRHRTEGRSGRRASPLDGAVHRHR